MARALELILSPLPSNVAPPPSAYLASRFVRQDIVMDTDPLSLMEHTSLLQFVRLAFTSLVS